MTYWANSKRITDTERAHYNYEMGKTTQVIGCMTKKQVKVSISGSLAINMSTNIHQLLFPVLLMIRDDLVPLPIIKERFSGTFKDDQKNGEAIYTWANGNRYK